MKRLSTVASTDSKGRIFSMDVVEFSNCTSNCYGHVPIEQEGYFCQYCDPKKKYNICRNCYEECHLICREEYNEEVNNNPKALKRKESQALGLKKKFACDCGIRLKHVVEKIEKKKIISCPLNSFDQELNFGQNFMCEDCQMKLCSVCFFLCHKECNNKKQIKKEKDARMSDNCECKNQNHSSFNEFTFQIPIYDYLSEIKTTFWPIQMINLMFRTGDIFKELNTLFKDIIISKNPNNILKNENLFPSLLEQFSNTFNRKFKTFFYNKNIIDMFPFEQTVNFMKNLLPKSKNTTLVKLRLMFIILFIHLKKDFDTIKTFTSIDFITCSLLERLQLKKFTFTKSEYTNHLHEKYHFGENDCGILSSIALDDFCPFMEHITEKELYNTLEYQDELEIGLKFVCFLLKRMLLNINDLIKLTKSLYGTFEKFFNGIKLDTLDDIQTWLELFLCFAEIFFMITSQYNDLVIEEYLNTGKFQHCFIHTRSEHGELLFKMIVKSCTIVSKHYDMIKSENKLNSEGSSKNYRKKYNPNGVPFKKPPKGLLFDKCLKLFHESLKLFSVTDNYYFFQIAKLKKENLMSYYSQLNIIHSLGYFYQLENRKPSKEYSKYINYNNTHVHDLTIALQLQLEKFFLNPYEESMSHIVVQKFTTEFYNFNREMKIHINEYLTDTPQLNENTPTVVFEILEKYESWNSFLKNKEKHFNYTKLTQELIFSCIDDTTLKILVFFTDRRFPRIINFELIELIISLLSMFLLTEKGARYFVTGKNLSRLNKLFHRHSLNKTYFNIMGNLKKPNANADGQKEDYLNISIYLLKFFEIIFKSCEKYKIDLTAHKVLFRFKKNFISHIQEFLLLISNKVQSSQAQSGHSKTPTNISSNNNDWSSNEKIEIFKMHLDSIMKIFNYLSPYYSYSDRKEINEKLMVFFLDKKFDFINPNNYYPYYYRELDDKGAPVTFKQNILIGKEEEEINTNRNNIMSSNDLLRNNIMSSNDLLGKNSLVNEEINSLKENEKIEKNLFFSFFKFFSQRESFISEKCFNLLQPLHNFFDFDDGDEKAILRIFKCDKLNLKEKKNMLQVMHKLFFLEEVYKENLAFLNKQITTKEYLKYLILNPEKNKYKSITTELNKVKDPNQNISQTLADIDKKITAMAKIEMLIKIYINELQYFPINLAKKKGKKNKEYVKNLLIGIKRICDFYYLERELWNQPILLFYNLAIEFLPKLELFLEALTNDKFDPLINIKNFTLTDQKNILIIQQLKEINFDVYDKDKIYKYLTGALDFIFQKTNINYDFSLARFLDVYDNTAEYNFTPFSLIESKDYEYFYEVENQEEDPDTNAKKLKEIVDIYIDEFVDINKTNYLSVLQSAGNEASKGNCRQNIVQYFKSYINSGQSDEIFDSLLCLMTKTFFYDTSAMQVNFKLMLEKEFLIYFNNLIQENVYRSLVLCKNIYDSDTFIKMATKTKLTFQFIQLLGEDFCTEFHDLIFLKIPGDINEKTIFENVIDSLKQVVVFINLSKDIESELPYDKLIVLLSNLIDFIVEFLVTKKEYSLILEKELDVLFFNYPRMVDIIKIRCELNATTRIKIISFVKVKFIQLVTSYIQNGKKKNTIKKLLSYGWNPIDLYVEILYNFSILLYRLSQEIPDKVNHLFSTSDDASFVKSLINLYIYESKFRETLELSVCFNLYVLIKVIETKYHKMDVSEHFSKLELDEGRKKTTLSFDKLDEKSEEHNEEWNVSSNMAYRIYKFFEELVLCVEVKTEGTMDQTEEISVSNMGNIDILEDKPEEEKDEKENLQTDFFIRPFLTYFLSKQTMNSFQNNVDRSSATTKYMGLINFSDYFLFEMAINRRITSKNKMNKFFSDFDLTILEWINYIIIISHNLNLLIQNYKSWKLPLEEYNKSNKDNFYKFDFVNLILAIIQMCYIVIVLIIWFRYKFWLYYQSNMLKANNMTFIYRQKSDNGQKKISKIVRAFFQEESDVDIYEVNGDVNKDIPLYKKIGIGIFDTILLNREICILVYTLMLLVLYLGTRSSMFIVIPVLFIANLFPILFIILEAIATKIIPLGIVMLFIYLITYFFTWIAYYFIADNFIWDDVFDKTTGTAITEPFCYSSIQCWFTITSGGIREGGGITDFLPMVSFKTDLKFFIVRFVFDMLFHLFVVLILLNIFLGIIVDAFAELRNKNWEREKDQKSICFICQLSSDYCLSKNIDFKDHVEKTHNLWNYVYFLTYLHLENANDFNRIKKYVWDKLGNRDYSWLPLESSDNED